MEVLVMGLIMVLFCGLGAIVMSKKLLIQGARLVREPDRYLGKLSPFRQYFSSINVQMGFGKFMINPKGLQATPDRLIGEIESMWSKKVTRKDDEEIKIL